LAWVDVVSVATIIFATPRIHFGKYIKELREQLVLATTSDMEKEAYEKSIQMGSGILIEIE
jgi:hypothetical protein